MTTFLLFFVVVVLVDEGSGERNQIPYINWEKGGYFQLEMRPKFCP